MQIGYTQVSTASPDAAPAVEALKGAGCVEVLIETASGAQRERPALKAALARLVDHPGSKLVVCQLGTLAMSFRQLVATVRELDGKGLHLRSLAEGIDTQADGGSTYFVFAALSDFDKSVRLGHYSDGLKAAQRGRQKGGRPLALSLQDAERAKALLADRSFTVQQIARRLGVSSATLYRYIPGGRAALFARQQDRADDKT
ncbi:MAG: recombinase [Alphaproteobacteria bacterium PA2]|nr:MAG: recombinase [Alphaproteobacteria bacterium PA2]